MECQYCGRWSPADRETGYDADDVCPECAEREEDDVEVAGPWVTAGFAYEVDSEGAKWLKEVWAKMPERGREFQVAHGSVCCEIVVAGIVIQPTDEPSAKLPYAVAIPADTTRIALRRIG